MKDDTAPLSVASDITFIMMCASYIWYRKYSGHFKKIFIADFVKDLIKIINWFAFFVRRSSTSR